ncbi:hypothetical protein ANO11243_044500 [Dothideomycetidae sp. 11243]|nr:hypothetical protein ANO11243_044500 [fungal sp. No.11243]
MQQAMQRQSHATRLAGARSAARLHGHRHGGCGPVGPCQMVDASASRTGRLRWRWRWREMAWGPRRSAADGGWTSAAARLAQGEQQDEEQAKRRRKAMAEFGSSKMIVIETPQGPRRGRSAAKSRRIWRSFDLRTPAAACS